MCCYNCVLSFSSQFPYSDMYLLSIQTYMCSSTIHRLWLRTWFFLTTCVCTSVKLKTLHYITSTFKLRLAFQLSSFSDPFLLPHSSISHFTTWSPPLLSSQFRLCASGPECSVLSSDSFERACFRMVAKKTPEQTSVGKKGWDSLFALKLISRQTVS